MIINRRISNREITDKRGIAYLDKMVGNCFAIFSKKDVRNELNEDIYDIMNNLNPKPKGWNAKTAKAEIRNKDASWKYSKLAGLRLLKWLMSLPQSEANRAAKEMYLYASSQSDKSSVYYKLQ